VALGELFAAHCTATLAAAISREGAAAALASRDLIGQAKGILMVTQQVSAAEAFDLLRGASQALDVKLRDVADRVTRTGMLP
jgi:AmiR/NasT family two-component response regulator